MPSPDRSRPSALSERAPRFRDAADAAIENLDWCINYLHKIQKHSIADALHRNRMTIVRRSRNR